MKKSDQRGAILGIVLICMLVLTILGYGFLHLSYTNAMQVDNTIRSNQALWLAEAGLQYAANDLSGAQGNIGVSFDMPVSADSKSNGSYTVTSITGAAPHWQITSKGTINAISRIIIAAFGPDVGGAINFYGNGSIINPDHVDGPIKYNTGFTFEKIFGMPRDSLYNHVMTEYVSTKKELKNAVKLVRWWIGGTEAQFSGGEIYNGILIVEGDMTITGDVEFNGIIWVTGSVYVGGNLTVNGAIFIGGALEINRGSSQINYNSAYVDQLYQVNNDLPWAILNWHEVPS